MKIVKLILHQYKRLFLNNITHLEYIPLANTQIILGQNGSGKSSLLEQLTPLPANLKKDFNQDGYKEIHIEHNEYNYILCNAFGNNHSFKRDGVELNDGGTVSIQAKLVSTHFNITNHINQILLGKNQFTTMSPTERKKWITDISTIDYSYPITVYNTLKQRHRDIVGGIKLLQSNIVNVSRTSLSKDDIDVLESDKHHMEILIDHMLTLINSSTGTDTLDNKLISVTELVTKIKNTTIDIPDTLDELRTNRNTYITKRDILQEQITSLYKDLDKCVNVTPVQDRTKLTTELTNINNDIDKLLTSNPIGDITDVQFTYDYINSNYTDIISILSPLTEHIGIDISRTRLTQLQEEYVSTESYLQHTKKLLATTVGKLDNIKKHINNHNELSCPECKYTWVPSDSLAEYNECKDSIDKLTITIKLITNTLDTSRDNIHAVESVKNIISKFTSILNITTDTKLILSATLNKVVNLAVNHDRLFSAFENTFSHLTDLHKVLDLYKIRDGLKDELIKYTNIDVINEELAVKVKTDIESKVALTRIQILECNESIHNVDASISTKEQYVKNLDNLKTLVHNVYSTKNAVLINNRNIILKDGIRKLRLNLLDIDTKLSNSYDQRKLLKTYQSELDELNKKEYLLKLTLRELSPSEGLIAKSISSFLNHFIQDMNYLISTVWGYDMEILSCDLMDNDLDYKFKVLVNNDEVIEDISKTSSSMQEMINLVFKVIFSKYKGFIGYPLILDEFGRTFDANHRITAYESLDRHIANDFSQIYMVSHFESMYGRFGNSDVSILGTTGVDVNTIDSYNEVMLLK